MIELAHLLSYLLLEEVQVVHHDYLHFYLLLEEV